MSCARLPWWAVMLLSACNVATVERQQSAIPRNQCQSNADCEFGSCQGNACVSTKASFDTVLFEVTPPADDTSFSGVQFLKRVDGLLNSTEPLTVSLDVVAHVSGEVHVPATGCSPTFVAGGKTLATSSDHSIPALITLMPSSSSLGLFASPIAVSASLANQSTWVFKFNAPPGSYDVYIQPADQADASCPVPPQLLRAYGISGSGWEIALTAPQFFEFHVTWPLADGALDGWSVDMLDSASGKAISNRVALSSSKDKTDYVATLAYLPVIGGVTQADQLVRLSPPDGVTAPTLLLARSGLGLFSANAGTLSQLTALPSPVHLEGQVTMMATPNPEAATVTLVATKIDGLDPGLITSFVRTVDVAADGMFGVDVLPGTYRVSAVPTGDISSTGADYAAASTEWVVGSTPSVQAGRVIELGNILSIYGVADDPSGTIPMAGAQVQAVPSPTSIATDLLKQAIGEPTTVPRGNTSTVDDSGNFVVYVDSGTFDFSIRPRASSGYAWFVSPSTSVGTTPVTSAGTGFDKISLPLPIAYSGTLSVPGATVDSPVPVRGALIDVYLYLRDGVYTSDYAHADSVLQIAETRSDQYGAFSLLIPASLNAPPHL